MASLSAMATALGCCAVLCVTTGLAAASTMETQYSPPVINNSYVSAGSTFQAPALQPLYDVITSFMRGIQQPDPLPPGMLVVLDGVVRIKGVEPDWPAVASYYGGIVAVVCVGLLLAVIMPVAGLLRCLYSCCCGGTPSSSRRPRKEKHVPDEEDAVVPRGRRQKRSAGAPCVAPLLLGAITCVVIASILLVFTTNAQIASGIDGIGHRVRAGISDLNLYLDNAKTEVNTFLDVNYRELSVALENVLKDCSVQTNGMVTDFTKSLPVDMLTNMADGLEKVNDDLKAIQDHSNLIISTGQNIVQEMNAVKDSVTLKCGTSCPHELADFINTFAVPTIPKLPIEGVSDGIDSVRELVSSDLKEKLEKGRKTVADLSTQVDAHVTEVVKTINTAVQDTGSTLRARAAELLDRVSVVSDPFLKVDDEVMYYENTYIKDYGAWRNYGFIAISLVLVVIAVTTTIALVCGCCSSRHSYGYLSIPVWLIGLTISVLMIIVTVLFLMGLVADRVCEAVRHPEGNQILDLVDEMVKQQQSNGSGPLNVHPVSYYITECQKNQPLYQVLDLDSTANINQILDYANGFSFDKYIEQVKSTVGNIANVVLLDSNTRDQLVALETSTLSTFDFTTFNEKVLEVKEELNQLDAPNVAAKLEEIEQLPGMVDLTMEVSTLKNVATEVGSMEATFGLLTAQLGTFEEDIKLGYPSLPAALKSLLDQVTKTEATIKEATPKVVGLADGTATKFLDEVQIYLNRVVKRVRNDALPCGPLSDIYTATVTATCDDILAPWNGFWASAGLCLLLFVPTAILAACLSSRRT